MTSFIKFICSIAHSTTTTYAMLLIKMEFSLLIETLMYALVLLVPLYFIVKRKRSKNLSLPTDWPIIGMAPDFLGNLHNIHNYITVVLATAEHNFKVRCPMATSVQFFATCDPENVRHIFTTNFGNFPKGKEFADVFGLLDGTIFTTDGESWRRQRAKIQHVFTRPRLLAFMTHCCRHKVQDGLVPLLKQKASTQTPFDMEELLGRLVFDLTVMAAFGTDPCSLSADMVPMHVTAAMDTVMEAAFYRHCVPVTCWKLMRWMNIGWERKLSGAEVMLRRFVGERIQTRMAGRSRNNITSSDILSYYINDSEYLDQDGKPSDLTKNTFINKMVALRDPMASALPWLIYNIATNPHALVGMQKELAPIAAYKSIAGGTVIFEPDETSHLLYQRAALFESLRLYPPGPIEHKTALVDDVLPSGHKVDQGDNIFISVYSMGRMESLWGQDCRDFRPDRWITEDGSKLRHVPSYKFMSFNTGPRSCPGKNIAVAQITAIAATIVWNFDVEVLEKHRVKPKPSVVLKMKNGLMIRVKKREGSTNGVAQSPTSANTSR